MCIPRAKPSLSERFVQATLSLYRHEGEFEIEIPEELDETEVAKGFRSAGCGVTYLTPKRTIVVAVHEENT